MRLQFLWLFRCGIFNHSSLEAGLYSAFFTAALHLETDVLPGDRCSDWAVFAFQGGVLWGVHGRGEEDPEVSGHQVYPEDGFKRQGEQRRERDRRSAKVRQITNYRLQACLWLDLKFYTPDFGRSIFHDYSFSCAGMCVGSNYTEITQSLHNLQACMIDGNWTHTRVCVKVTSATGLHGEWLTGCW